MKTMRFSAFHRATNTGGTVAAVMLHGPAAGENVKPAFLTDTITSNYTNYRYWPEMLSSGVLPRELCDRIVRARLNGGGQSCRASWSPCALLRNSRSRRSEVTPFSRP